MSRTGTPHWAASELLAWEEQIIRPPCASMARSEGGCRYRLQFLQAKRSGLILGPDMSVEYGDVPTASEGIGRGSPWATPSPPVFPPGCAGQDSVRGRLQVHTGSTRLKPVYTSVALSSIRMSPDLNGSDNSVVVSENGCRSPSTW